MLVYKIKFLKCKDRDLRARVGAPGEVQSLTYMQKYIKKMFKNLRKSHCTRKVNIYTKACTCIYSEDSNCKNHDPWTKTGPQVGFKIQQRNYIGKK